MTKVFCKDCKHFSGDLLCQCYRKDKKDYVLGNPLGENCFLVNINGECKDYKEKK